MTITRSAQQLPARRPPMLLIFVVTASGILANSFVSPALPDIRTVFGLSDNAVGLFVAAGALPGVFLAPITGVLADRYGRRTILAPSLVLFGLGGLLSASASSVAVLMVGRTITGIGLAAPLGMAVVLIGDFWDGPDRSRVIGLNAAVLTVCLAVYPVLGGQVAASFGWRWVFLPYTLVWIVAGFVWWLLPPTGGGGTESIAARIAAAAREIRAPRIMVVNVTAFFVFALIFGLLLTVFPLLLEQRFDSDAAVRGRVLAVSAVVSTIASLRLGALRRRITARRVAILGLVSSAVSYAIIGAAPTLAVVAFGTVFFGFGEGVLIPMLQDLVTGSASEESRGAVVSGFVATIRAGQSVGPVLFGALVGPLGSAWTFYLGAALLTVTALAHSLARPPLALPDTKLPS